MSDLDRDLVEAILADGGRTMRAEPQDIVALLDFVEGEDGRESTAALHPEAETAPTGEPKL